MVNGRERSLVLGQLGVGIGDRDGDGSGCRRREEALPDDAVGCVRSRVVIMMARPSRALLRVVVWLLRRRGVSRWLGPPVADHRRAHSRQLRNIRWMRGGGSVVASHLMRKRN